jgi:phospholipid/cholesterol/gamma-HCH transport system permease protein
MSASDLATSVVVGATDRGLEALTKQGRKARFYWLCLTSVPLTIRRYRVEVYRQLSDITWGSGALIVGGGTVGVMALMSTAVGAAVGIQGYTGLKSLGLAPLVGFLSAFANTRELAPIIAAIAFAAQVGCRYTAQLGSMRIAEEIDALEVMAIRSVPYLVVTRMIAAMTAIIPLYFIGLVGSYFATRAVVTVLYGQSAGSYDHYFNTFLSGTDIVLSTLKVVIFTGLITLTHCYLGYTASGGPEGVGVATGNAIRNSIVLVVSLNVILTIAFWGLIPQVQFSG